MRVTKYTANFLILYIGLAQDRTGYERLTCPNTLIFTCLISRETSPLNPLGFVHFATKFVCLTNGIKPYKITISSSLKIRGYSSFFQNFDMSLFELFNQQNHPDVFPVKILSWNVNGISKRLPDLIKVISAHDPDIVCLQETRIDEFDFPSAELSNCGYSIFLNTTKGRNGVAILSKVAGSCDFKERNLDPFADGRGQLFTSKNINIINIYAPNASHITDDSYNYKLCWFRELYKIAKALARQQTPTLIVGDFNLVPDITLIHPECLRLYPAFFTEILSKAWSSFLALGYHDTRNSAIEKTQFTWWSYQSDGYRRNVGMCIDHAIFHPQSTEIRVTCDVILEARESSMPSDHAPILLNFIL